MRHRQVIGRIRYALALALLGGAIGCASGTPGTVPQAVAVSQAAPISVTVPPSPATTKHIGFAILEDYDKGDDLTDVARDFALMRELGVHTWRGSFGWDDYEPAPGRYDFAWLHRFADLAARYGIELRPYIGYTPRWAAAGRTGDGQIWNDPPARRQAWRAFVRHLVTALRRHRNIRSYEIYNEENVKLWWDGTVDEYSTVLADAAAEIRAADPNAQILLGGMVWPDAAWLRTTCYAYHNAERLDVVPFHAYPETWTPDSVTVENYLGAGYRKEFLETVDSACGHRPVWINETGFATTPGKTERAQANWWARAIATFAAAPRVEEIGIYEIKDLRPGRPVIGDAPNYHLGITHADRSKKLAFFTVDLLTDLLGTDSLVVADGELETKVVDGKTGALYHHLLIRPDGKQVLFVWDKRGSPTLDLRLARRGASVTEYALAGTATNFGAFDGHTLRDVRLTPGEVRIFCIDGAP